ncbi:Major facilitator superfamily domain, general substrate transporter [Penicillium italicum]|uniref:Major facilitator superfamily domain, general substrate transporter n=1 Tax=Penicillium italicum TaxID=40296 RepID=A0A0A2L317_PENIT|nr:Major facilitator superfamily domain, general substrate transporter [Penicillium italicum]
MVDSASSSLPGPGRLMLTIFALFMGMFTANLDSTILATAIPYNTNEFHSIDDIGWYGSATFLTFAAFQTTWGKAFKFFHLKWSYLLSLFIFELGSLICAVAPNSATLIVGRAIAGIGGAGLCTGTFVIIGYTVAPERQAGFMGVMGASYALASFVGLLVGGAFTEKVAWRWCFYLNLPIGGLAAFIIVIFFETPKTAKAIDAPWREKLLQLDPSGCVLIIGAVVCYLLALQWGGLQKNWSDRSVIGTLLHASVVPRLLKRRRILVNCAVVFSNSGGFFILAYYLPLYFQSIRKASPVDSGVRNLPFLIGGIFSMISGVIISATQQFVPFMAASAALSAVGGGLIYTIGQDTSTSKWVGYQILAGASTGFISQIPIMANTACVDMADMSAVSAMTLFFQLLGGSFSVSAAQSVFGNTLLRRIRETSPNISPSVVLSAGASELRDIFPEKALRGIRTAYMDGIQGAFAVAMALLAVSFPLALLAKWEKLIPETQSVSTTNAVDEKAQSCLDSEVDAKLVV